MIPRPAIALVAFLIALACYRFTLVDRGHFFWGDEQRYLVAEQVFDILAAGDYRVALALPYTCLARPGFVFVSLLPVLLQRVVGEWAGIPRDTLPYYDVVSSFNVVVTLGISVCLFALGRVWIGSGWWALLMTAVHSLLGNANIWVRHLMPYNEALLFFLIGLWLVSVESSFVRRRWWRAAAAGALTVLGYTCYPAYYPFVVLNALSLLVVSWRTKPPGEGEASAEPARASPAQAGGVHSAGGTGLHQPAASSKLRADANPCERLADPCRPMPNTHQVVRRNGGAAAMLAFGSAAAAVVGLFEGLARVGGTSFLGEMLHATGAHARQTQGYSGEGFVFIWRYLRDVEGPVGIALFLLFAGFAVLALWRRNRDIPRPARAALVLAVAGYLFHAALAVYGGRTVFYGRTVSMYLPFLTGGAVLALIRLPWRRLRVAAVVGLVLLSCGCFARFAWHYARLVYPADLLAQTMADMGRAVRYPPNALLNREGQIPDRSVETVDPELVMVVDNHPEDSEGILRLASHEAARSGGARFIGVNFKYMVYVRETDYRFSPPEGYRLLVEAVHPNAFPATWYEVHRPWERRRLSQRRYTMRLYERTEPFGPAAPTER